MFRAVVVVGWWALVSLLPACATRKEFQKGYERGAADTVKRQYWILQNLQKEESAHRLTYYRFTIPPDPDAPPEPALLPVPPDPAVPPPQPTSRDRVTRAIERCLVMELLSPSALHYRARAPASDRRRLAGAVV